MGYEAIDLYERTPPIIRDGISHICVLNACSHAGLVNEARSIFDTIEQKTENIVTTMVCVRCKATLELLSLFVQVDCLSRLSLFAEAQQLIDDFEKSHSPYLVMYSK
jgi:pentatricopeptide repeat protein